jgi:hypothetical protein
LLGKLQIPKTSEELEEKSRRMMKNADLNELAFTELILSIDVSNTSGKIAFGILKSCKRKDYEDGNATHAWEKLKKKFHPVSAPTFRRIILIILILQVGWLIGIFLGDISLTLTKIKFTILMYQGQVSEFDPPSYD